MVLPTNAAADAKPNIILILADDLGYGDLGCYGQQTLPTPNIDRMAAEGMKFTQHYAGDTVCAPSRCVLLTGLHTGHCRIRGNSPGILRAEDVLIPEVLKPAGYHTACIGKWGVGAPPALSEPNDQGFDEFYGYVSMWHAHNFYPEFLIRNGKEDPLRNVVQDQWKGMDGRGVAVKRVDYAPHLLSDEVSKYIDAHHEMPFFLYYALNVPHTNNEGGKYNSGPEKGMEVPSFGPYEDRDWPGPEKGFAAIMRNIDLDVGRILDKLKEHKIDKETLVIFTSDNGPHQEGGHKMDFFDSNGPLQGMKRDLYEGGVRVPFIAWWPGTIQAGSESNLISGFQDLLPTFADVAGVEAPKKLDGISMLPTLNGNGDQQQHDYLYWEFSERQGRRAIRQGNWKLVQSKVATTKPDAPELYDLDSDLAEQNDLAKDRPELVEQLTKLMDQAHQRSELYPLFASEQGP